MIPSFLFPLITSVFAAQKSECTFNDVTVLSMFWLPGQCKASPSSCPDQNPQTIARRWSIHGLWPNKVENCFGDGTPTPAEVATMSANVKQIITDSPESVGLTRVLSDRWWNGDHSTKGIYDFVTHEFVKHGTCHVPAKLECHPTVLKNLTGSIRKYVSDVSSAFYSQREASCPRFNLYQILSKAKIVPGGSYTVKSIEAALNANAVLGAGTKKMYQIRCLNGPGGKYLSEISVVYSTTGLHKFDWPPLGNQYSCGSGTNKVFYF